MRATPMKGESWKKLFWSAPSFLVVHGQVHWTQGGVNGILNIGEILSYRRHGQFSVEYARESYAIIHHTTLRGETKKIFIPPEMRLYLSNGQYLLDQVNYQSFVKYYAQKQSA